MAPTSPSSSGTPIITQRSPEESQSSLPGIKRGIAIGVASSVAILLIALLAFLAWRHRKRAGQISQATRYKIAEPHEVSVADESIKSEEKPLPPVEVEATPVYELEAVDRVLELPIESDHQRAMDKNRFSWCMDDDHVHLPKRWERSGSGAEPAARQPGLVVDHVPFLWVSPPACPGVDVSPLLPASSTLRNMSPVSPLRHAHFRDYQHIKQCP